MDGLATVATAWPYLFERLDLRALLDIALVATAIYLMLVFIKQTRLIIIFNILLVIMAVIYAANLLGLQLTQHLLQPFMTFFIVIFVVVFQRELRRFFEWLSFSGRRLGKEQRRTITSEVSAEVVDAVEKMAEKKVGALIVLAGDQPLDSVLEGGFPLDGKVSEPLLLSIFDPSSPGHDGAVIIDNNRIKRFGVHLPLAEGFTRYREMGTRHRAAAGVTQRSDSLALVVSEERGIISVSENGVITEVSDTFKLEEAISAFLKENLPETRGWRYLITENLDIKIVSAVLAVVIWMIFVSQSLPL